MLSHYRILDYNFNYTQKEVFSILTDRVVFMMAFKFYLWHTELGQLHNFLTELHFCHATFSPVILYVSMYKANTVCKLYSTT